MPCDRLPRIERGEEAERLPARRGRGRKETAREVRGRADEGIGRVGDSRRVAGDVGDVGEEEILRLAARGYWKEARRDERRS